MLVTLSLPVALLLAALPLREALPENPVIVNGKGVIFGVKEVSAGNFGLPRRDYAAFYGVPFAKALRFKPPERLPLINDTTFEATNRDNEVCLQNHRSNGVSGREDCLALQIFTPAPFSTSSLDVLVLIHGGAFMYGKAPRSGIQHLMDHDVVLVTVDYRVGVLGYLSFEDEVLPGNLGMLDQVEALRWVQENIGMFGGNKSSVTLIGHSAGSASALLHTMSPMSKGLFHKVIGLSGSPLNPWAQQHSGRANAVKLAELANCTASKTEAMLDCMRKVPANQLIELQNKFQGWGRNPFSPFAPVVDRKAKSPFMPEEPYHLLAKKQVMNVPMILSLTTEEGLYTAAEFILDPRLLSYLDLHWDAEAPAILHFHDSRVMDSERASLARRMREHYLSNNTLSDAKKELVQMMGDRNFVVGVAEHARMQAAAQREPVYFYSLGYRGQYSLSDSLNLLGRRDNLGVCHADDFLYFLDFPWAGPLVDPSDMEMRRHFINMWVSFASNRSTATFGNVDWKPVEPKSKEGQLRILRILGPSNVSMEDAELGHNSFWKSLPIKENGNNSMRVAAHMPLVLAALALLGLVYA